MFLFGGVKRVNSCLVTEVNILTHSQKVKKIS